MARRNSEEQFDDDSGLDGEKPRILKAVSYGLRTYLPADPDHGRKRGQESDLAKVIRAEDIPRLKKEGAISGPWKGATGPERRVLDELEWSQRPAWEREDMIRRGVAPAFVTKDATA